MQSFSEGVAQRYHKVVQCDELFVIRLFVRSLCMVDYIYWPHKVSHQMPCLGKVTMVFRLVTNWSSCVVGRFVNLFEYRWHAPETIHSSRLSFQKSFPRALTLPP
jgi:hypothetical protein